MKRAGEEKGREAAEMGAEVEELGATVEAASETSSTQSEQARATVLMSAEELWLSRYPMDTLHSWLVLAAGFFTYMAQMGLVTSFGLYVDVFSEEFGATVEEAIFTGGLTVGIMSVTAIMGAVVYRMLGSRLCVVMGASWAVLGFLAACQAQSLLQLYSANIIIGLGFGFNLISIASTQVDYFDKYRIFALSFQSVGAAVGTTAMPKALLRLMELFGWRGSLLSLSGASALFYVVAAVMASRRPRLLSVPWSQVCQLALLKRKTFLVMCLNSFLWGGAGYSFYFLTTMYIRSLGMERSTGALVITVLGVCNIGGRIASAFLSTLDGTNRLVLNAVSCAVWSLAAACFQFPRTQLWLVVTGGVFGAGFGLMYPTVSPLLLELFGAETIAASQGLAWFCLGLGCLSFPWLAGWLVRHAGYGSAYTLVGAAGLAAAAATAAIALVRAFRLHAVPLPGGHLPAASTGEAACPDRDSGTVRSSLRDSLRDSKAPLSYP